MNSQEAFSQFFDGWAKAGTRLLLTVDRGMGGGEFCTVEGTSPGSGLVNIVRPGIAGAVPLNIASASGFSFEDWRETPAPEGIRRKWRCFLSVDFPDGRTLLFAEPIPDMETLP
jgi:hypothetical protein